MIQYCDSTAAKQIALNPRSLGAARALGIRMHTTRYAIAKSGLSVRYSITEDGVADMLTKRLARPLLARFATIFFNVLTLSWRQDWLHPTIIVPPTHFPDLRRNPSFPTSITPIVVDDFEEEETDDDDYQSFLHNDPPPAPLALTRHAVPPHAFQRFLLGLLIGPATAFHTVVLLIAAPFVNTTSSASLITKEIPPHMIVSGSRIQPIAPPPHLPTVPLPKHVASLAMSSPMRIPPLPRILPRQVLRCLLLHLRYSAPLIANLPRVCPP